MKHPFSQYTASELARAVTAPKLSTGYRIKMLDEISRREVEDDVELPWTDEDEAALDEWEERRRERIAEANEY